jgi:hypothetical protein
MTSPLPLASTAGQEKFRHIVCTATSLLLLASRTGQEKLHFTAPLHHRMAIDHYLV